MAIEHLSEKTTVWFRINKMIVTPEKTQSIFLKSMKTQKHLKSMHTSSRWKNNRN